MADASRSLPRNAAGDFFVDDTCIDCATCRWVAPATFDRGGRQSRVYRQPAGEAARLRAEMALLACPTGSIGTRARHDLAAARERWPEQVHGPVLHCGYHSAASYGAASYLILRPAGNVLVDSPRFTGPLVRRLEALGGIRLMVLTHKDDIADHQRFRDHFGCDRVLHVADIEPGTRDVERPVEGSGALALADDLLLIPVPGHTRGSVCLLYRDTYLFSGDHVAWSPALRQVHAFRDTCWYDWRALQASMRRLAGYRFEWILPGHGWRCHFPAPRMALEMARCLAWMARQRAA